MSIKPQGLFQNARLEKKKNLIWKLNAWQEPRRGFLEGNLSEILKIQSNILQC